ncbi:MULTISPECIES: nitric oxide synthase oxygenase [Streptomyces]|uniref:Nitric oxide synthase oxygenase n=1 Tax=Streptomyces luteosporeus TaxID=173856 RepID=A0ABP6G642_9ACTN
MTRPAGNGNSDTEAQAEEFLRLFHAENTVRRPLADRLRQIRAEIGRHGTYAHTPHELAFGARVAWRNSNRCIGRLYWRSLVVRDRRHLSTPDALHQACVEHLHTAYNGGRIRPTITVFAPQHPDGSGPRIHNPQLVRYAGHRHPDGHVTGDRAHTLLTDHARALGWSGGNGTPFDVLPLILQGPTGPPRLYDLPADAVHEVPLAHPDLAWFAGLHLRWHALPVISDMTLDIGGVRYPAAPFNGWYMGTEIGARNLVDADRYDLLPLIADRMGLDTTAPHTLWKDRALVELNVAVLWSFRRAGVTISDHHTESERFLRHLTREEKAGRQVPADWSWIVPPLSGGITPVFHRYYDDGTPLPGFTRPDSRQPPAGCPAPTGGTPPHRRAAPVPVPAAVGTTDRDDGDSRDHDARP